MVSLFKHFGKTQFQIKPLLSAKTLADIMRNVLFRTYPRLFNPAMTLSGIFFMGTFAKILFLPTISIINQTSIKPIDYILLILFLCFVFFSIICFYYFLTTKSIRLTKDKFIIKNVFLPYKRAFDFKEIKSLDQTPKKAYRWKTYGYKKEYFFTEWTTIIKTSNGKIYKTNSLIQSEYELLVRNLMRLRSGQEIIKKTSKRLSNYLVDNLDGIIWVIFCLVVTILLVYNFSKKP